MLLFFFFLKKLAKTRSFTCASGRLNTSWLATEATRQKWLHLVVLMCMTGEPGSRSLLHLMPEARAQRDAETAFSCDEDDDGDVDDGEEGGNRGDRSSVAFPRVTDGQERSASFFILRNTWIFCLLGATSEASPRYESPCFKRNLLTHIPRLSGTDLPSQSRWPFLLPLSTYRQ